MKQFNQSGCKTKARMAEEYGVCLKTFSKLLTEHGIFIKRHIITPKEQEKIYSALGPPAEINNLRRFTGKDNPLSV